MDIPIIVPKVALKTKNKVVICILDRLSAYDMMSLISEWLLSGRRRVLE